MKNRRFQGFSVTVVSLLLELGGFCSPMIRPVKASTGRMSRGPPLRAMATVGGGGSNPARNRRRSTGFEG
jgi:hypothetical protein